METSLSNTLMHAEQYAEARGDELWFKNIYTGFRQYNGVREAVWKTIMYLYSTEVANQLVPPAAPPSAKKDPCLSCDCMWPCGRARYANRESHLG